MSEADRLNESGRHTGVRVLEEDYDVTTGKSSCRVVFSRTSKSKGNLDTREEAERAPIVRVSTTNHEGTLSMQGPLPLKESNASFYLGLIVGFAVFMAGAVAMTELPEFAKYL